MTTEQRRIRIIEVLEENLSVVYLIGGEWMIKGIITQTADHLLALTEQKEMEKLQAFKKYVHDRLDALGIDKHEEQNAINGCRIGSRIDDIATLIKSR